MTKALSYKTLLLGFVLNLVFFYIILFLGHPTFEALTNNNTYLTAGLIYGTLVFLNVVMHWVIKKRMNAVTIKTSQINLIIYVVIYVVMYSMLCYEYSVRQ